MCSWSVKKGSWKQVLLLSWIKSVIKKNFFCARWIRTRTKSIVKAMSSGNLFKIILYMNLLWNSKTLAKDLNSASMHNFMKTFSWKEIMIHTSSSSKRALFSTKCNTGMKETYTVNFKSVKRFHLQSVVVELFPSAQICRWSSKEINHHFWAVFIQNRVH